jgi:hypothetical protein
MVGTRKPGKGQNMEIHKKGARVYNVYEYKKFLSMYRIHVCLNETGCVLNEKMMPDITIIVPELEIVLKLNMPKTNISMYKCGGTRNFQPLRPQTLQFLMLF